MIEYWYEKRCDLLCDTPSILGQNEIREILQCLIFQADA